MSLTFDFRADPDADPADHPHATTSGQEDDVGRGVSERDATHPLATAATGDDR